MTASLPEEADERNRYPMADGLIDYFPNALAAVSEVSRIGNEQHNPGEALHWARGKSTDHANKVIRHLVDRGKKDKRGVRHSARMAWRALALLQEELEREEGVPMPRNAIPSNAGSAIDLAQPDAAASAAVDELMPPGTPPQEIGD